MDRLVPLEVTTSTVGAVLGPEEQVLTLVAGVGLYEGKNKVASQQAGTLYLTSHRLLYVDDAQPLEHSVALPLELVCMSEYYAGFLRSSAKITLVLRPAPTSSAAETTPAPTRVEVASARSAESLLPASPLTPASAPAPAPAPAPGRDTVPPPATWVCRVCGFANTAGAACALCGVPRPAGSGPGSATATARARTITRSAPPTPPPGRAPVRAPRTGTPTPSALASDPDEGGGLPCPVCTFSNHPAMVACEMCGSSLATAAVEGHTALDAPTPPTAPATGAGTTNSSPALPSPSALVAPPPAPTATPPDYIKLSFRMGGDKDCYAALKAALQAKAWARPAARRALALAAHDIDGRSTNVRKAGIDGVLSAAQGAAAVERQDVGDALRDMEALMKRAAQMVELAERLSLKLAREEARAPAAQRHPAAEQETASLLRSSLVKLGLPAPAVLADQADDSLGYRYELARELGGLLVQGLLCHGSVVDPAPHTAGGGGANGMAQITEQAAGVHLDDGAEGNAGTDNFPAHEPEADRVGRGIMPLDETWAVWNRARGIALVSPATLRDVAPLLKEVTRPRILLRILGTSPGVAVLHTPRFTTPAFACRAVRRMLQQAREQEQEQEQGQGQAREQEQEQHGPDLVEAASRSGGTSLVDLATVEQVPIPLAAALVQEASEGGLLLRDDGPPGGAQVRWFPNVILPAPLVQRVAQQVGVGSGLT